MELNRSVCKPNAGCRSLVVFFRFVDYRVLFNVVACQLICACSCAEKVLCELIQPVSDRLSSVHEFVSDVQPSLRYCIVPITDPFGPAVTDPQLECIVVSDETVRGANSINVKRVEQVNVR